MNTSRWEWGFRARWQEVKKFDFPVMFPYWSCLVSEYPGRWNERHKDFLKILDYSAMEYWVMGASDVGSVP